VGIQLHEIEYWTKKQKIYKKEEENMKKRRTKRKRHEKKDYRMQNEKINSNEVISSVEN
jgi:hypothetical protein